MHVNVSMYFILNCPMHQIFIMSTEIIFDTELGPVVVRGGRVYIKAWSMQMILAGNPSMVHFLLHISPTGTN